MKALFTNTIYALLFSMSLQVTCIHAGPMIHGVPNSVNSSPSVGIVTSISNFIQNNKGKTALALGVLGLAALYWYWKRKPKAPETVPQIGQITDDFVVAKESDTNADAKKKQKKTVTWSDVRSISCIE